MERKERLPGRYWSPLKMCHKTARHLGGTSMLMGPPLFSVAALLNFVVTRARNKKL
jgi:hypothetical protein